MLPGSPPSGSWRNGGAPSSSPPSRSRRSARTAAQQEEFVFDEGKGLSTKKQQYDPTSIINEVRGTWIVAGLAECQPMAGHPGNGAAA
jgi:hypothetical protein